jgi:uncharacterized protein with HEPN domain
MSKRDPALFFQHMLDHAQETVALVQGKTRADLDADRLLNLALVRLLEIIGAQQARYPQIPWPQIVSLRNRLIHGYDAVDLDIVWQIVTQDMPGLISSLEEIVSSLNSA